MKKILTISLTMAMIAGCVQAPSKAKHEYVKKIDDTKDWVYYEDENDEKYYDYSEATLDSLANKEMVIKNAKEDLDAYYSGNTQYYEDEQNLLLNQLEQLNDSDKEKYEKYWNILAYNRNIHMKDTLADSIHNNKHDFIGVGCKHLYGKKGIIQLLKDDGYLVECMK